MILDENGKDTAEASFSFRVMAKFTNKEPGQTRFNRPDLFDAKCRPLDPMKVTIGNGSTVKIAFEILRFYTAFLGAGVSPRLRAVQVLSLTGSPARGATDYGFVEEEGDEAYQAADDCGCRVLPGRRCVSRFTQ